MPSFAWESARALRLDPGFAPRFPGHLYAQPLYWRAPGREAGMLIVASESNPVAAIDAGTGATLWSRSLGAPVPLSTFRCGNIDPLGITGTPAIDEASGAIYLDAMLSDAPRPPHLLFGLSLPDPPLPPSRPLPVPAP